MRRGETASWDVYMESMQAIGSVVPWMLTEVRALCARVLLPPQFGAPPRLWLSAEGSNVLAGRATMSGTSPSPGIATKTALTTLVVSMLRNCSTPRWLISWQTLHAVLQLCTSAGSVLLTPKCEGLTALCRRVCCAICTEDTVSGQPPVGPFLACMVRAAGMPCQATSPASCLWRAAIDVALGAAHATGTALSRGQSTTWHTAPRSTSARAVPSTSEWTHPACCAVLSSRDVSTVSTERTMQAFLRLTLLACRFIEADLAAVDRSITPWVVLSESAGLHHELSRPPSHLHPLHAQTVASLFLLTRLLWRQTVTGPSTRPQVAPALSLWHRACATLWSSFCSNTRVRQTSVLLVGARTSAAFI